MSEQDLIRIITFYEFRDIAQDDLAALKIKIRARMHELGIKGTIILAREGFNSTVSGLSDSLEQFISELEEIFDTKLNVKESFHKQWPFRRAEVKVKPEIVTLKKRVEIGLGKGTHVSASKWNEIISDEETVVLDTRNDYEFQTGTFERAINPQTKHFSELPEFVEKNLDPSRHKKVAMFCTGGIRCEKFAPYLKQLGFENVYQLEGGILKYLEETDENDSLWNGECFVFDSRVSVDSELKKGNSLDHSQKASE
jgi:UPF0176 protein